MSRLPPLREAGAAGSMPPEARAGVALIGDDECFRGRIEAAFAKHPRFELIGSFPSGEDAVTQLQRRRADVALIDLRRGGASGFPTLRRLRYRWPRMHCVVLANSEANEDLFAALEAGAAGYLLKSDDPERIIDQLDELMSGGVALSRSVARRVIGSFSTNRRKPIATAPITGREREIMDELAGGHTYKEIARKLGISPATVKNHLYRIYEKLGVRSRTEAVVKWMKR